MPVLNDVELEKKWVAALRSGEYQQTRQALYDGKGFCCLGVLCEIMERPKSLVNGTNGTYLYDFGPYTYTDDDGFDHTESFEEDGELPPPFREQIGMSLGFMEVLIEMNDTDRNNFSEIAEWIEGQRNAS